MKVFLKAVYVSDILVKNINNVKKLRCERCQRGAVAVFADVDEDKMLS